MTHDVIVLLYVLSLFVLIILSYFFSGMETALTSLNVSKLHDLSVKGNKKAHKVIELYDSRERVIGTILLGNTIVNILSSSIAAGLFVQIFGNGGIFMASVLMTIIILIFAEVLPKTYAINHPESVALFSAPYIILLERVFNPVTRVIQVSVDFILNILKLKKGRIDLSARDALRNIIFMHKGSGVGSTVKDNSLDMVNNILDLKELDISQVMTHKNNIFAIDLRLPLEDVLRLVASTNHSRIPFWIDNEDNIVGILHVKDLFNEIAKNRVLDESINIKDLLSEPLFVPDTTTLAVQVSNFRENKRYIAVVVDEYGVLQGLVTLEDILEEIVGEIHDEHNKANSGIISLRNGSYVVPGDITIRDINRELDLGLPDDVASTIAGLVIYSIRRIPNEREQFKMFNCIFYIHKKDSNRILFMRVMKINDDF